MRRQEEGYEADKGHADNIWKPENARDEFAGLLLDAAILEH